MQPLKWLKKLMRSERGNALIVCSATLPLVIGAAAIGVDTIQVSLARRQLQRAADSAAIAGAYAKYQNQNVNSAVNYDLTFNNDVPLTGSPTIQNAPTVGPYAGNTRAVRVVLTATRAVPFMHFFTGSSMTVTTEATAMSIFQGQYCAISLENTNTTGIAIGGNATVNLGCGMISNSPASNAVTAGGSSTINASPMAAVGGVPSSSNYASNTVLLPYSPQQADPFSGLPTPTLPASGCSNNALRLQPNDAPMTLSSSTPGYVSPGVYCFRGGINVAGTLTIPSVPGGTIVYLDGGAFDVGSQGVLNANGVTFILTSSNITSNPGSVAQVSINGGATLNMTAPDSGTYAGVLMYQDRRAEFGTTNINGNSSTSFRGSFYFPNRELVFNGTSGMHTECVQLVARRLGFTGNSAINNVCPSGSGSHAFDAIFIRLVA